MMLSAKQILDEQLIFSSTYGKPAQVGYDLSLNSVSQITPGGKVLKDKTELTKYFPIIMTKDEEGRTGWNLPVGCYDVVFNEGCNIPANRVAMIRQRSSVLRNGGIISSSVFDPGFKTDRIGTVLIIFSPMFIEQDARVAQMYFHECAAVSEEDLYDGQWQNDKQRKK